MKNTIVILKKKPIVLRQLLSIWLILSINSSEIPAQIHSIHDYPYDAL